MPEPKKTLFAVRLPAQGRFSKMAGLLRDLGLVLVIPVLIVVASFVVYILNVIAASLLAD